MSLQRSALMVALVAGLPGTALAQGSAYAEGPDWEWRFGGVLSYFLAWLGMTFVAGLLAAALAWLVPDRSREAVLSAARREPGASVGAGLLVAIALPLLGLALVLTIIGSPLGVAVWVLSIVVAFVGFVASAWIFGRLLAARSRAGARLSHTAWLFVALGILCALTLIPVLGTFVWIAASVFGTGAVAVAAYRGRRARLAAEHREPPPPPRPTEAPEAPPEPSPPGYPAGV